MKKITVISLSLAFALALALTGCVTQVTKESKSSAASEASVSASAASQGATTSSTSASSTSNVNWTSAITADAAAKGAQIASFGAPTRTVIADFVFTNPTFAYTEHVAQATYEVPSSARLIVRKAEGAHTAALTDRAPSEFSQTWNNTYEGFDVTSYGATQGQASICVWNDGTKEYGVTIAALGSANVTMDAEDIDDIVKAVKAANSTSISGTAGASGTSNASGTSSASGAQQSTGNSASGTPGFDVAAFVNSNNLGTFLRYYYTTSNGQGYWAIVTRTADGGEYTTYADLQGNVIQGGVTPDYDGADFDVAALVQSNGLGQFKRYYWIQGENGTGYWGIVTIGADGAEHTTYTDERGNIIQGGVETGSVANTANNGADFDVAALVQSNGLGQFEHYYWIQGSGNTGYWGVVTRGADGAEYTTYVDEQGNIIQGGR